jgi:hypothetical protein
MSQEPLEDTNDVFNLGSTCTRVNTNEKVSFMMRSVFSRVAQATWARTRGSFSCSNTCAITGTVTSACPALPSDGGVAQHTTTFRAFGGVAAERPAKTGL